jgi:hypothetical protein
MAQVQSKLSSLTSPYSRSVLMLCEILGTQCANRPLHRLAAGSTILLVGGSANSSLYVISCHQFHEKLCNFLLSFCKLRIFKRIIIYIRSCYDTMKFCRWLSTFLRNTLPPSSGYLEDGTSSFLSNTYGTMWFHNPEDCNLKNSSSYVQINMSLTESFCRKHRSKEGSQMTMITHFHISHI